MVIMGSILNKDVPALRPGYFSIYSLLFIYVVYCHITSKNCVWNQSNNFFLNRATLSWISPSLVALYKKSEKSDLFFLPKNEQFAGKTKDSIPKDVQASNSQTFNNKKMSLK